MTPAHFDHLETRTAEAREIAQFGALAHFVRRAKDLAPGWAAHLDAVDAMALTSREALAAVPVLRKHALKELQTLRPPFAGFATDTPGAMGRIMMSPGPIFEPEGYDITFAEMSLADKNKISHRGRAMEKLIDFL